jgi:hypothetical protein
MVLIGASLDGHPKVLIKEKSRESGIFLLSSFCRFDAVENV